MDCQAALGLDLVVGDGRGAQGLGMALGIGQEGDEGLSWGSRIEIHGHAPGEQTDVHIVIAI